MHKFGMTDDKTIADCVARFDNPLGIRKIGMPDDKMVERGMTPEERVRHQRKLAAWKQEDESDGKGT